MALVSAAAGFEGGGALAVARASGGGIRNKGAGTATVQELVKTLSGSSSLEAKSRAAGALEVLSSREQSRVEIFVSGGVRPLVQLLAEGGLDGRLQAARTLAKMATQSQPVRKGIYAAGALPVLLTTFSRSSEPDLQACAANVLSELSAGNASRKSEIAKAGTVPPAAAILKNAAVALTAGAPANARLTAACTSLVSALAEAADSVPSFVAAGVVPSLVTLLNSDDAECAALAASALVGLAVEMETQLEIERLGAVPPLIRLLSGSSAPGRASAAGALSVLALSQDIAANIVGEGGLPPAVALLTDGTDDGKVEAAKFFMNLTNCGPKEQEEAIAAGAVVPLVFLLSRGTPQGRARAAGALRNIAKDADNRPGIEAAVPLAAKPVPGGVQSLREALQKWCF